MSGPWTRITGRGRHGMAHASGRKSGGPPTPAASGADASVAAPVELLPEGHALDFGGSYTLTIGRVGGQGPRTPKSKASLATAFAGALVILAEASGLSESRFRSTSGPTPRGGPQGVAVMTVEVTRAQAHALDAVICTKGNQFALDKSIVPPGFAPVVRLGRHSAEGARDAILVVITGLPTVLLETSNRAALLDALTRLQITPQSELSARFGQSIRPSVVEHGDGQLVLWASIPGMGKADVIERAATFAGTPTRVRVAKYQPRVCREFTMMSRRGLEDDLVLGDPAEGGAEMGVIPPRHASAPRAPATAPGPVAQQAPLDPHGPRTTGTTPVVDPTAGPPVSMPSPAGPAPTARGVVHPGGMVLPVGFPAGTPRPGLPVVRGPNECYLEAVMRAVSADDEVFQRAHALLSTIGPNRPMTEWLCAAVLAMRGVGAPATTERTSRPVLVMGPFGSTVSLHGFADLRSQAMEELARLNAEPSPTLISLLREPSGRMQDPRDVLALMSLLGVLPAESGVTPTTVAHCLEPGCQSPTRVHRLEAQPGQPTPTLTVELPETPQPVPISVDTLLEQMAEGVMPDNPVECASCQKRTPTRIGTGVQSRSHLILEIRRERQHHSEGVVAPTASVRRDLVSCPLVLQRPEGLYALRSLIHHFGDAVTDGDPGRGSAHYVADTWPGVFLHQGPGQLPMPAFQRCDQQQQAPCCPTMPSATVRFAIYARVTATPETSGPLAMEVDESIARTKRPREDVGSSPPPDRVTFGASSAPVEIDPAPTGQPERRRTRSQGPPRDAAAPQASGRDFSRQ